MKIAYAGGSDQNGCKVGSWYDGSWDLYLDPADPVMADLAAKTAEEICMSKHFKCSMDDRWSGYHSIRKNHGDIELSSGAFDCSSFVLSAWLLAGLDIEPAGYTGNMEQILVSTGLFHAVYKKDILSDPSHARRGGIYLKSDSFCIIVLEDGARAQAHTIEETDQANAAYDAYRKAKRNAWKRTLRQSARLIRSGNIEALKYAKDGIFDLSGNLKRDPQKLTYVQYGNIGSRLEKIGPSEPYLPYDQIPQTVINDFIGYEDRRFFEHRGYDLRGILRSLINNLLGRSKQGASTITMQLAKILFITNYQRTLRHKAMQLYLAILLEHHFSKQEILALYINSLCFGNNCYGITEASMFYLSKTPDQLSVSECAYITSISQSPGRINPLRYPETTEFYRKNRLKYIRIGGFLTQDEYEKCLSEVPVLHLSRQQQRKTRHYDEIYTVYFSDFTHRFSEAIETVYQRLKREGFSPSVIAGILANMHVESGFLPNADSSQNTIGLIQWTDSRADDLKRAFPDTWDTLESQLDFMLMECDPNSPYADSRFIKFVRIVSENPSVTPEYASDLFQALIERNLSFDHRPDQSDNLLVSPARFPETGNACDNRFYLDAPRRRNYALIYADCIFAHES